MTSNSQRLSPPENVGPADADADSSGDEFLVHERAEQKAGGDLHAPGGFAGAYIAAVDSDLEFAGGHLRAPGGFVSACVAAESLDKGPADATAEVAGEALRTPGGPVDPNVAAHDLDLGPADGAAEFADEALRDPGGLVDDNAVLGSPQPGLDAGRAKETSMAARIPCMPPAEVAGLLSVFLADGAVAEKAYIGFMAFWDLVRKATGDSAGGPREVLAAASLSEQQPPRRKRGEGKGTSAQTPAPPFDVADWVHIVLMKEVACPCLRKIWADYALSEGIPESSIVELRQLLAKVLVAELGGGGDGKQVLRMSIATCSSCSS